MRMNVEGQYEEERTRARHDPHDPHGSDTRPRPLLLIRRKFRD